MALTQALALSRLDVNIWLRGLRLIRKVSGTLKILPSSYILPEECVPIGEVRIDRRSTVVTDGTYQGRTVAIKCLNVNGRDSDRIFKVPIPSDVVIPVAQFSPSCSVERLSLGSIYPIGIFCLC